MLTVCSHSPAGDCRWPVSDSLPQPLGADAVAELRDLVRRAGGPREAGRRMRVSPAHLCNIIAGRRQLFPHLLARAKASLQGGPVWGRGYVRLWSGAEWEREHGQPYPLPAAEDDDC